MSSPPPPPSEGEEEEGVVVMASVQLLLPFSCKGAPLPPGPPPPAAAEATTFTGAFSIASALLPFLSFTSLFTSLFSKRKLNQKLQINFPLNFFKKDFKLIFSKGLVQIVLPIVTKEEDEGGFFSLPSRTSLSLPAPAASSQCVCLWRPHI
jgi:hypothetical protein